MKKAVEEMGTAQGFRGYGPEQGYEFLREEISKKDYKARNIDISENEIFVSDGSKCDCGNIVDIFAQDNKVAITDPVYPVYLDTNVMSGRSGKYKLQASESTKRVGADTRAFTKSADERADDSYA